MSRSSARAYITLSIAAALITMGLKFGAYQLTSSVGLFSDLAESSVNLVAALTAFWALTVAAQPPDKEHTFGHSKAEYFSSGLEGLLILVAALSISLTSIPRLLNPQPLTQLELGMGLSIIASIINGGVAMVLLRAGERLRSITLRADAHHLLTDVWTSVGVIGGLVLVKMTGWLILDPLMAIVVALHIAWVAFKLLRESMSGLMDSALCDADQAVIQDTLTQYQAQGIHFHALRTRVAGTRSFVSFHVLVPGDWSVQKGHALCETLEQSIMQALPGAHVMTHLEPLEDPISWADAELDRVQNHQP
ncbi:MAG: cation transporter [Acaryochloridaceae cyanobacterium SU_2_1]|nr:cation transporter [Acaryochloridaceae cyanobacterium SU_2_1]NJM95330.1 cation transporter [Acaryochloridaceae cyanobacterium CSU_5_19]